jgi:ribose transport system substrate-binding protein
VRDPYLIKSVAHAAQLLAVFESSGEVVRQCDLVQISGLSRGIVHRLLYTLERHGLVEKLGENRYRSLYRRSGRRRWTIGYGAPGRDSLFVREVGESLQTAIQGHSEIRLLTLDHRNKPAVTVRNAEQFVSEKVNLVIEYQMDEHLATVIANLYHKAGIPVIAVNYPHPGATYFGANNYEAGLIGGRHLGKLAKAQWNGDVDEILMLELGRAGIVPKSRLSGMVKGICQVLGREAEKIPAVYLDGNGQFEDSWDAVRRHLRKSRSQRTLVGAMNDDSARGVLRAYAEGGRLKECLIMGQGGSPEAREELRRSETRFAGSVAYFPEAYGQSLVRIALDILNLRYVPPAVFTRHQLITAANVNHLYPNDSLMRFPVILT